MPTTTQAERGAPYTYTAPLPGGTDAHNYGEHRSARPGVNAHVHAGDDISAPAGTVEVACTSGRVSLKPSDGNAGNVLDLHGDDGNLYRYFHIQNGGYLVSAGDRVTTGQPVARVGATGDATGPHLHFEYHPHGGAAADPSAIVAGHGPGDTAGTAGPVPTYSTGASSGEGTISFLLDPHTYIRLLEILGGAALIAGGIMLAVKDTKAAKRGIAKVKEAATVAAEVAAA